jgi:hypothetical protein
MSLVSRSEGQGLQSFRLSDVPFSVRYRAYERCLKDCDSLRDQIALGIAVNSPSDKVYFVPAKVWDRESRKQTWRRKADA